MLNEQKKITLDHIILGHHPYSESDRMLCIQLLNRDVFLCTRCTGQYLGLLIYTLFIIKSPTIQLPTLLTWVLPFPATFDWLSQTLKKRISTTPIRLITGFLFGIWLGIPFHAMVLRDFETFWSVGFQTITYLVIVMVVLFINKGSINNYLKPYEDFIEEYQRQKSTIRK